MLERMVCIGSGNDVMVQDWDKLLFSVHWSNYDIFLVNEQGFGFYIRDYEQFPILIGWNPFVVRREGDNLHFSEYGNEVATINQWSAKLTDGWNKLVDVSSIGEYFFTDTIHKGKVNRRELSETMRDWVGGCVQTLAGDELNSDHSAIIAEKIIQLKWGHLLD